MVAAERGPNRGPSRFGWLVLGLLMLLTFGGTSSALLAMCLLLFARAPASAKAGAIATAMLLLMAAPRLNGMTMNKSWGSHG